MPSNKELINEANNLADELELSIQTDGLKNEELSNLVSDLRAKKRDAENVTQADSDSDQQETDSDSDQQETDSDEAASPVVAEGRSVTTKRGVIGPGKAISPKDLNGGQASFDKLVKAGIVKA